MRFDAAKLSDALTQIRFAQGMLLGKMSGLGFPLRAEMALAALTSEITQSGAIEGERLDAAQVRSSIARKLGIEAAGIVRVPRTVDGLVEMMLDATRRHQEPLTAERLFGWHCALFPTGRNALSRITVGAWRPAGSGPMRVMSGAIGEERVHFEAPGADRVPEEMTRFLRWFNEGASVDWILKAGLAHLYFVTIHPFEDGNGRMARAISEQALARSDGSPERFYSLSSQIEKERGSYYHALEECQRGDVDVTGWLCWFLGCLGRALESAEQAGKGILRKAACWRGLASQKVNDRQQKVVNRLLDGFEGFLTTSKYAKITKCSPDTALRDIRELAAWGVLRPNGKGGRGAGYALAEPAEG